MEEQLKQRVIGECLLVEKRKSYKRSTSRSRLTVCRSNCLLRASSFVEYFYVGRVHLWGIVGYVPITNSKSPQVSRTLLTIWPILIIGWSLLVHYFQLFRFIYPSLSPEHLQQMVSSSPLWSIVFLVIKQDQGTYFCFRFLLFSGYSLPGQQKTLFGRFSFLLIITRSGRLAEIRWSPCISKSDTFSQTDFVSFIYHLFVGSN